ncbi:hypothetical protein [Jannaschia donghaensis]|uniref:Uncharacterized protein n=1 Tax=Jannaschia donghaensis TaxID=420998 RepID=A0A0M6YH44_9RHOB|nr:hypothetical protein [Jannaschia donghaensis]CTQ49672.1 hypothetical protein JDO7802_01687 [Jannaschia donghaensis]
MVSEPKDAPVPDKSKTKFYIGLVVAILIGGALVIFVLPNLYASTTEGPAADAIDGVVVPGEDGLQTLDGDAVVPTEGDPQATSN